MVAKAVVYADWKSQCGFGPSIVFTIHKILAWLARTATSFRLWEGRWSAEGFEHIPVSRARAQCLQGCVLVLFERSKELSTGSRSKDESSAQRYAYPEIAPYPMLLLVTYDLQEFDFSNAGEVTFVKQL